MPKSLLRIVALLLAAGLATDSTLTVAVCSAASTDLSRAFPPAGSFNREAIPARILNSRTRIPYGTVDRVYPTTAGLNLTLEEILAKSWDDSKDTHTGS